jgi:alpha-L-fucosidase
VLGGEWRGRQTRGRNIESLGEALGIPLADYRQIAREFNPVAFDAQRWVHLAKLAGMKYLVITAKHQEGFAMYRSRASKYNIVDSTPFKRDPLAELAEACRREGIRFCVYYSHRDDYDDPNSYVNYWDFHETNRNYEKYLDGKVKPQLRELLTGYGPLGLIWFDHGLYTAQQAKEIVDLVRSLQPGCLINGRVGNYDQELMGDYQSLSDHGLPAARLQEYFERPQTLNDCWGYSKFDANWKPPKVVIRQLVDVVSKGGNYLLDVGPTGSGIIPEPAGDILEKVGAWLQRNGESIYGTSGSPFLEPHWGRCTAKGEKLYLHVFDWPADGVLAVAGLKNDVKRAYLLLDASRTLEFTKGSGGLSIRLPAKPLDDTDTVLVVETASEPEATPPVVTQEGSSTPMMLDYVTAVTAGRAIKRFNRSGGYHISKWIDPQDTITWSIRISNAQRYQVWITYAAEKHWAGGKYRVSVDSTTLEKTVVDTGASCLPSQGHPCEQPYRYRTLNIGVVELPKAGQYKLTIGPASAMGHDMMYLRSIELIPPR